MLVTVSSREAGHYELKNVSHKKKSLKNFVFLFKLEIEDTIFIL